MSDVSTEARVHALGNEGARLLTREPALAAAKFEEAHDLAIRIGMAVQSSSLSSLIARSWSLRDSSSSAYDSPEGLSERGRVCRGRTRRSDTSVRRLPFKMLVRGSCGGR